MLEATNNQLISRRTPSFRPLARDPRHERGVTMVELMISMLLAAILSAGLFYMTSGQQRVYTNQLDILQLQEGLWGAMAYLKRQVRVAGRGFGGCMRGRVFDGDPATPSNAQLHGLRIFNGCNLSDPAATIDTSSAVAQCTTSDEDSPDSFAIMMRDDRNNPPFQVLRAGAAGGMTLAVTSERGFVINDLVIVYPFGDPVRPCVLRKVTGTAAPSPPTYPYARISTTSPFSGSDPAIGYPIGSLVVSLGGPTITPTRYFAIDNKGRAYPRLITWLSTNATNPGTDRASGAYEIVAEGIEDMQIAWACDVNDNLDLHEGQTSSERINDEWAHNVKSDILPNCDWRNASAVRITLIARSHSADPRYQTGFRPAAEDHAAGTSADDKTTSGSAGTFTRRVLTVVVKPENMQQQGIGS